ncbi:MAG: hypothetical protein QGG42_18570 [Phycisphaerae bacterium]|jgi:hypothetical protein|nr:hypothetical protein [Phycisphaerae bacterium]
MMSKRNKKLVAVLSAVTVLLLLGIGAVLYRYRNVLIPKTPVSHAKAVAWPAGVEVHPTEFRMLSLATSFGPDNRFELAGDGELFYPWNGQLFVTKSGDILEGKDGQLFYRNRIERQAFTGELSELKYGNDDEGVLDGEPDGERTIREEVWEALAIGTQQDCAAVGDRKSGWYVSRTYIDRKKSPGRKYRLWQLDVTYYTGTRQKAPHRPRRCLEAAGMVLGDMGNVEFNVPGAPGVWGDKPVTCRFVQCHNPRGSPENRHVQYYVYSLNGYPETSHQAVRLKMASAFVEYVYFAKIAFHPVNEIEDLDEAKQAAGEFVKYMLPEVLKALPMPEDIKKLESGAQ